MITEARMAFLEGRVTEQSEMFSGLQEGMSSLVQRMDRFEERMDRLHERMDRRFEQVDVRFAQVDTRFLRLETRLDQLGGEMSKNFRWIVGIQITTLITVVATLLGALAVR